MNSRLFFIAASLAAIFSTHSGLSQGLNMQEHITGKFLEQVYAYPQEKIYLHTDKTTYFSGERIWMRAHVVNALSHEPLAISRYVYIELLNPLNIPVRRIKIKESEGCYNGYIDIPENISQGNYAIRAYTAFMRNTGDDYGALRSVPVVNPGCTAYDVDLKCEPGAKGKLDISLEIGKRYNNEEKPDLRSAEITYNNQVVSGKTSGKSIKFSITPDPETRHVIHVKYDSFSKYFHLPHSGNDYDVVFFAEGGYIIPGGENIVAFKALDRSGLPVPVSGRVMDSAGREVAVFNTEYDGMGKFPLAASAGEKYTAVCRTGDGTEKKFELPLPQNEALKLTALSVNRNMVISVSRNIGPDKTLYLLGHCRAYPFFVGEVNAANDYKITFDKTALPTGVIHFLLVDEQCNVYSERLVFSGNNSEIADLRITTDKASYGPRSQVSLEIQEGSPYSGYIGSVSVSVTDDADEDPDHRRTILADLLLASDIRGYIADPDHYLANPEHMDLLMMVNGWRRYDVPSMLKGNFDVPEHPLERGQEISGTVRTLVRQRPLPNVSVSIISEDMNFFAQATSDSEGGYSLTGIEFPDSTTFIIQAIDARREDRIEILVDENEYPTLTAPIPVADVPLLSNAAYERMEIRLDYEEGMRIIDIDEIGVRGTRREAPQPEGYLSHAAETSFTLKRLEEIDARSIPELLMRVAGVSVTEKGIIIRGNRDMGRLIRPKLEAEIGPDGQIVGKTEAGVTGGTYAPAGIVLDGVFMEEFDLYSIPMQDVARVDVFKSGSGAIFGMLRGFNGVISITTKRGNFIPEESIKYNIRKLTPLGFQKPAEFYSPKYETAETLNNPAPDMRSTILWEPHIIVGGGCRPGHVLYGRHQNHIHDLRRRGHP